MFERTRKAASLVGLCDDPELVDQVEVDGEFNTLNDLTMAMATKPNHDDCGLVKAMSTNPRKDFELLTPLFGVCTGKITIMKFSCPDCGHEDIMTPDEFEAGFESDMEADITCKECDHDSAIGIFYDCTVEEVSTTRNISPSEVASVVGSEFGADDAWLVHHYTNHLKQYFALLSGVQCMTQEGFDNTHDKEIKLVVSTSLLGYDLIGSLHAIDTHRVSEPVEDFDGESF